LPAQTNANGLEMAVHAAAPRRATAPPNEARRDGSATVGGVSDPQIKAGGRSFRERPPSFSLGR
jgi:hypothetical protein